MKVIEDLYRELEANIKISEKLNFNPYYCNISSGVTAIIKINEQEFINLASNNYLGLANDARIKEAMTDTIEKYGASMCGTPIASGYADIFKQTEEKLSSFLGMEDTIIFPSGYQANTSLISTIAGKDDAILVDHYAHASLIQGIQSSCCKIKPFRHNDMDHLKKKLERSSEFRQIFVITESVFSTEGSIAPFDEIVSLCKKFNAVPIIDDSHGIGVIGKSGKGILEEKQIKDYDGIYTASLGKALGIVGGIVSGNKKLIACLRYYCSGLIYSTALPPVLLGGILKAIEILENDFEYLLNKVWQNKRFLTEGLLQYGYKLAVGEGPITSILSGSLENTGRLAKKLFENNIFSTPFVPPSVPPNQGKIRLIAGADLSKSDLEEALKRFKNIAVELRQIFPEKAR